MRTVSRPIAIAATLLALAQPARALLVDATVEPLGTGGFRWQITIENDGLDDVAIVSLLGGPLDDAAVEPSLAAPAGFLALYDPALGIVDFLEDTALFAAGLTLGGFGFDSAAGPEAFGTFEALTVAGDLVAGDVAITLIPEPHSAALVALGLGALLARARRMEERR
jgi:MYXO-CTERM domain-containing protein